MTTSSAPRIRNTVMRSRKMRGDESLKGSRSRAMALCVTRSLPYRTAARKEMPGGSERRDPGGSFACGSLQQLQQPAMHALVSGNDVALLQHGISAVEIGDE